MGRNNGLLTFLMTAGLITNSMAFEITDFGNEIPGTLPRLGKTQFVPMIGLDAQDSATQQSARLTSNDDVAGTPADDLENDNQGQAGSDAFDLRLVSQDSVASLPRNADLKSEFRSIDTDAESKPGLSNTRKRRVLVFKASWCGACQALNYEWPKLEAVRWKVGETEANHIQIVDADARPDLMAKYGVYSLPTIVLIDDDKELKRQGLLNAYDIAELFHGRL